jgi:hypothetical protein
MVSRELENDVQEGVTDYDDDSVTVADYSKANGYFSNQTSAKFPNSRVLTIEDLPAPGFFFFFLLIKRVLK